MTIMINYFSRLINLVLILMFLWFFLFTDTSSSVNGILKHPSRRFVPIFSSSTSKFHLTQVYMLTISSSLFIRLSWSWWPITISIIIVSYKEATGYRQHINLSEVKFGGRGRKYGDESSRTESSFQTDTTNRTYSDSSRDSRDGSVSLNPTGSKRYRRNEREGSIRRSRSRSMTSSQSAQTKRSQRSSSCEYFTLFTVSLEKLS
jgi:hypothetical protein